MFSVVSIFNEWIILFLLKEKKKKHTLNYLRHLQEIFKKQHIYNIEDIVSFNNFIAELYIIRFQVKQDGTKLRKLPMRNNFLFITSLKRLKQIKLVVSLSLF